MFTCSNGYTHKNHCVASSTESTGNANLSSLKYCSMKSTVISSWLRPGVVCLYLCVTYLCRAQLCFGVKEGYLGSAEQKTEIQRSRL